MRLDEEPDVEPDPLEPSPLEPDIDSLLPVVPEPAVLDDPEPLSDEPEAP